ncbi:MAG: ABC transporter ATP-binding protein [Infirmifilum sp.]
MLAIEARKLRKSYAVRVRRKVLKWETKVLEALKGVTLEVRRGEVFGILGHNGAGKSTLVKILATLLLPDSGTARVLGYDVVEERDEVRKVIGVSLSVERGFFPKLTARENLKYFGMLRGLSGRALEEKVGEVLELLGLQRHADKLYEELSLGMKARLSIARALLHDPEVLILDEPTLGLDPVTARRVRSLLVSLARNGGKTVLLTTHNLAEAEIVCDRVAIMSEGRILAVDEIDELRRRVAGTVFLELRLPSWESQRALPLLKALLDIATVTVHRGAQADRILIPAPLSKADDVLVDVLKILKSSGFKIRGVNVREPSLEDVFVELVGRRGG